LVANLAQSTHGTKVSTKKSHQFIHSIGSRLLATAIHLAKAADLKETNLSSYFQDISVPGTANAMVIPIAGIANKLRTFTQFGTVFVNNDFITESADPNSP